jgi:hypothetical protein
MTPDNFWICVESLAAVLENEKSVNDVADNLLQMAPAKRSDRLQAMTRIVTQLSRIELRFKS